MSLDVFEEDPPDGRAEFGDDAGNVWPEVAFVVFSLSLAGCAERLARVARENSVNASGKGPGVESLEVVPDGRVREVSGLHGGDERFAGVLFPLDVTAGVEAWLCEHEAHIQSTAACAEGDSVPGTWHHVTWPLPAPILGISRAWCE